MKRSSIALATLACALALAFPAQAKKDKPADSDKPQEENTESGGIPRYQPFPHGQNFILMELNGKAPPREIWLRIDATDRATGSSGCKNWSGIFVIGPDRLGPRAMPAFTEQTCDPAALAFEREYWNILLSGPHWDTKGDDLILKALKGGGTLRFSRSL
ncbi:MAG TPA: META domain-containing protein [Methylocystis sp.]|jgi:heat shock protein HslJ